MPTGPISAKSVCSVGTIVYEWLRDEEIRIRLKNLKQLKREPAPVVDIYFVPEFSHITFHPDSFGNFECQRH